MNMFSQMRFIGGLAVLTVAVSGCFLFGGSKTPAPAANTNVNQPEDTQLAISDVNILLSEQNDSSESGVAVLSNDDGKTKVVISLNGAPSDIPQPAHIHSNLCANIGGVVYPLTNVVNGSSETVLDVSLGDLLAQGPLSLNVHKSAAEVAMYVACGDLPAEAMMEDDAVEPSDTQLMEEKTSDEVMMEEGDMKVFAINATNFSYNVKELRVRQGDKVRIDLTSVEGFHDWVLDDFSAATERVNTDGKTSVEFTANKKGTFEYYCSVGSHRQMGMVGNLIVE